MPEKEYPEEAPEPTYERDKTANEPVADAPKAPIKPKVQPRKVFVAKKMTAKDRPMEYRARHILLSSKAAADMFRQSILEFQQELADQPADDPDKEFHDMEKVERFFVRLAKKYSICSSKELGGDLDWIHSGMPIKNAALSSELVETIVSTPKNSIPEPLKTHKGFHLLLVCETRPFVMKEKSVEGPKPITPPSGIPG